MKKIDTITDQVYIHLNTWHFFNSLFSMSNYNSIELLLYFKAYRRDQLDKKEATEKKKKAKEQESSVVIDLDTNGDSNDDNAEDVEPEADEDYNPEEEVEEEEDEEGEEMDSAKGDDAEVVEISDESADT